MEIPCNLISDSSLVQETLDLLTANGGRASFAHLADSVFCLSHADKELTAKLITDLIGNDPRFIFEDAHLALKAASQELSPLSEIDFVVLDVEAITSRSLPARVIELGAYHLRAGHMIGEFQTLINPEVPLPRFIAELTGITDGMLTNAPVFADIARAWLDFTGDAVLVAHNSNFDLPLLNREISRCFPGYRMRNAELCTVDLARRLMRDLDAHNLDALAEHFGLEIHQRHRAASDALATARLFLCLLAQLESEGVANLKEARTFRATTTPHADKIELLLAFGL